MFCRPTDCIAAQPGAEPLFCFDLISLWFMGWSAGTKLYRQKRRRRQQRPSHVIVSGSRAAGVTLASWPAEKELSPPPAKLASSSLGSTNAGKRGFGTSANAPPGGQQAIDSLLAEHLIQDRRVDAVCVVATWDGAARWSPVVCNP